MVWYKKINEEYYINQKKRDSLKLAIREYNKNITAISKSHPEKKEFLPSKIKLSDVEKIIGSNEDYKKVMNDLRRFTRIRNPRIVIAENGERLTQYELNKIKRDVNIINERREKYMSLLSPTEGTLTKANVEHFKPIKISSISKGRLKGGKGESISRQASEKGNIKRLNQYKTNYLNAMKRVGINSELLEFMKNYINKYGVNDLFEASLSYGDAELAYIYQDYASTLYIDIFDNIIDAFEKYKKILPDYNSPDENVREAALNDKLFNQYATAILRSGGELRGYDYDTSKNKVIVDKW